MPDSDTRHEPVQGWQEWTGGICPVDPAAAVEYRLRMGREMTSLAGWLRWDHGRTPESAVDVSLRRNDIVAYRVIEDAPMPNPTPYRAGAER